MSPSTMPVRAAPVNLDVVVPDLFLAAGAGAQPYRALALPALETILARGGARSLAGCSIEDWLAGRFGLRGEPEPPLAALSLIGEGIDPGEASWMHADPVHIEARGDRLLLSTPATLAIGAGEAASLAASLNTHFAGDGLEFLAPAPCRWYVRAPATPRLRTTPTAEAARRGFRDALPRGEDAPRWVSILNEAQMLLHEHPCNAAREARGAPTVNGIWFWGAGRAPRLRPGAPYGIVWTAHPLAAGIATAAGLAARRPPEDGAAGIAGAGTPQLLVLESLTAALGAGIERWRAELEAIDARWFAPLFAALGTGAIDRLALHCLGPDSGREVLLSRWTRMRLWRAQRSLARYAA
ncbi:MAG: hypothetical protein IT529_14770 [Burkholderiales bacterium]|nr:hypothetical protein [Burkholderiales bacterium]